MECLATMSLHQLYHNNDTILKNSGSIKRRKLHSKRNGQTTHWMNKNQTPLDVEFWPRHCNKTNIITNPILSMHIINIFENFSNLLM